jgi:fumarylacetoacetate (FAA) hydrolase family protein
MPKAVVSIEAVHVPLTTLEGAWVKLKRLSFGQKMERQQMATDMMIEMEGKSRQAPKMKAKMDMMTVKVTAFDFEKCIVDHNLFLDDEEQAKMDLNNPAHIAQLDPKVGEEIQSEIDKLNNVEAEEGNSSAGFTGD